MGEDAFSAVAGPDLGSADFSSRRASTSYFLSCLFIPNGGWSLWANIEDHGWDWDSCKRRSLELIIQESCSFIIRARRRGQLQQAFSFWLVWGMERRPL
ncbi:hypothetical protein AVEN_231140-1 [Araneus ventricosus]|uniref:Uncharacterized protein n=1 Tax=Araneus ventricosus TaxID=182803 RepID=A0A4Y2KXW6_ARAVE|nr:hypothetical protein AVEN_231140-1 [Araneus ventricosus]